jgi:hypothetical protein
MKHLIRFRFSVIIRPRLSEAMVFLHAYFGLVLFFLWRESDASGPTLALYVALCPERAKSSRRHAPERKCGGKAGLDGEVRSPILLTPIEGALGCGIRRVAADS